MINGLKTRGERLKARRLELGMTLQQVAKSVDMSLPGVQNLERGDVMPSLKIGLALAKCLRKPVQWILFGTESDPDRVPVIGTTESGPDSDWQQENLPTQNDSCHLLASGKPFMRSLSEPGSAQLSTG